MSDPILPPPLRYEPSFETPEPDEAETTLEMQETLLGIARTMADSTGHARRSVHAKSYGLLHGQLQVLGGLPPALAQGIFAQPRTYPVVLLQAFYGATGFACAATVILLLLAAMSALVSSTLGNKARRTA